jgi:hypothetical protein
MQNSEGAVTKEARVIIHPGLIGDPWWDTAQLMLQMNMAVEVFKEAYPDCVALFVFNQSSAHASLAPDALRAFKMNKSDSGTR